jgi:thioredoxin reductase (NADPH)
VNDIIKTGNGFEVETTRGLYNVRGVIITTGAKHSLLDVPGERTFSGRGVSYCATCDGYMYKDGKSVVVIGGGNTALTDALYIESIGAQVTIVHRRDRFSAEDRLKQSVSQRKIEVLYNSRVVEILGSELVEKVKVEDIKKGKTKLLKTDAVFIAIGYEPNNDIARKLGLEIDGAGYIKTDTSQRTSLEHVYAAGDVTGGVKQITVAVGQGSVAAITAFNDLSKG